MEKPRIKKHSKESSHEVPSEKSDSKERIQVDASKLRRGDDKEFKDRMEFQEMSMKELNRTQICKENNIGTAG